MAEIWTIGLIARAAGVALHRAEYFVKARKIRPVGRAGSLRVFDPQTAQKIIDELRAANTPKGVA